jgi:non-ribosomal peptide synthetase component F/methionyl-tRNA formyltransferase
MQVESRFSCCLIGEKSLLILCAEELLRHGHEIRGIATENDEIRKWSAGRHVPTVSSTNDELAQLLSGAPCDYLLSVVNYRVLPDRVLSLPERGAINFHDGPLPGYAGMHVTTWALINGEREHGISWHWMVQEIDGGGVLKEKRFPVRPDDTATSLNTKCFEAGFEAFRGLLTDLEQGTVASRQQVGPIPGGYYALRKRPERLSTLDWSRPAEELDALFRGLDFGRYENPIGCAKVVWGDRALIPGRFTLLEQASTKPPGTLEKQSQTGALRVHTATKVVEVGGFRTLGGEPIELFNLPAVSRLEGTAPKELDAVLQRVCVHEKFWVDRLIARDVVGLPYIPSDVRRDQGPQSRIRRQLDVKPFAATENSSSFVSQAVAAVSLYLGRLNGKEAFDVDFQSRAASDLPPDADRYFATAVPLRVRLNWTGSFADHERATAEAIQEIEKRPAYARDLVVRFPQITDEHRQKLREVPDVAVAIVPETAGSAAQNPVAQLAVLVSESGSRIELVANGAVLSEQLLEKIADELTHVLAQVRVNSQASLAEISVVAPREQALLAQRNAETRIDYEFRSLPQLFHAQVERTPDATAVVFHGKSITYRQLDTRSNQLANLLIARGVGRGDVVGVLMDRSIEMVVSMYAALKAGAAYVPMDPAYPAHRLQIMAEDAQPKVILTEASRADELRAMQTEILVVDHASIFDGQNTEALHAAIQPDDVAYVMYTSGSTGRPKGVMVTHGNIQSFFLTIDQKLDGHPPGTWLALTSISFDISIPELFWTLTRGARVVLRGSARLDQPAEHARRSARSIDFSLVLRGGADRKPGGLLDQATQFAEKFSFAIQPDTRGGALSAQGPRGKSDLASCVTADDHPETFRVAAEIGAHILTRAMGQSIETLAKNIALYRKSWKEAGHAGEGRVTALLPTLIGQDAAAVKAAVHGPMTANLKKDRGLIRESVWDYPAFQRKSEEGITLDSFLDGLSDAELTELVEFAFERSYATGGLFGNRTQCLPTVQAFQQIGVDEIACLVDFGLPAELILQHLPELHALKLAATGASADEETDDIATLIERHQVTHFQCTPPRAASLMWDQRTRQAMTRLQLMIVGGEAMSEELARQLRSTVSGQVFNVYGPTETTVWSTMQLLTEINGPVPIGRPIGNTQIYVTDERQQPLPIGVPGELLIGGDGVGRGYLKRPDLTQTRFIKTEHGTVYRTGDLVRLRPDGVVEFLGRFDDQVKIRGHRIELGEIEAVLESHPAVRKAVVHPQDDTAGGKRLVAYIVPNSADVCGETLRPFVSQRLPEFMVPSHFETMSDLPLTPSGKVDRRALPKPNFGLRRETGSQKRTPPQSATERQLAELWQALLEVSDIDRADNFFELGGHSLLGMWAISQISEKFGVRLASKSLLVGTLAQVAAEIDKSKIEPAATVVEERRTKLATALLERFPRFLRSE